MIYLKIFLLLVVFIIILLFFLNYRTQHHPLQSQFISGRIPPTMPNGMYAGKVNLKNTTWKGKKFDNVSKNGINIFDNQGTTGEAYPFTTYVSNGNVDSQIQTVKIDYNIPQNPLWLRMIVDEVVEIQPGHLLGKLIVRLLPRISIGLGYFELIQQPQK